ncbi:MAG: hypothetical protein HKN56_11585 [Gammaproteobacteria bacterium]|nr:hypothetical protein [Gammaproteobacteria bacterium]NND55596.1 hypothetical protein [Gammaproteobacteria bacterium]
MTSSNDNFAGRLCAVWAVVGFSWILLDAIIRLGILAWRGLSSGLEPMQWLALVLFVAFMAYSEGYRGFQTMFSPRTAARAFYLFNHPSLWSGLLAPLFCMGFFRATRRPFLVAWVGTAMIVALIISLRFVPQPWRSIVDAGVVVGLTWGLMSFLACVISTFKSGQYPVAPEVPDAAEAEAVKV